MKQNKQLSKCCKATMTVIDGKEGTSYYQCDFCLHPCDTASPSVSEHPNGNKKNETVTHEKGYDCGIPDCSVSEQTEEIHKDVTKVEEIVSEQKESCPCCCHSIHYPVGCIMCRCSHCSPSLQERDKCEKHLRILIGKGKCVDCERETDWEKEWHKLLYKHKIGIDESEFFVDSVDFIKRIAEQTRKETGERIEKDLEEIFSNHMEKEGKEPIRKEVAEYFIESKYLDNKETK